MHIFQIKYQQKSTQIIFFAGHFMQNHTLPQLMVIFTTITLTKRIVTLIK